MIIGVCGICASGKSTLSREIAKTFDFQYIEVDKYNIKLLKKFSKAIEKFLNFEPYSNSETHTYSCLKNIKEFNTFEQKLYYILNKLNITYRLPHMVDKKIKTTNNLVIDYVELDKFPFFDKCDIKILMKTETEVCKKNIKNRNSLSDENITLLEKNGIVNFKRKYEEKNFDYVLDINSPTFKKDKEKVFEAIAENIKKEKVQDIERTF